MTEMRKNFAQAFTLIEVLVVVAIIALLVSILIPTLKQARDQGQKTVCSVQMHQALLGLFSYANENKNLGPHRGYFLYTVAERPKETLGWPGQPSRELDPRGVLGLNGHLLVNLGQLWPKYINRDYKVLYCPAWNSTRDAKWDPTKGDSGNGGGWKGAFVSWHECYWIWGGYNYGHVLQAKTDKPKIPPKSPSFRGTNNYPPEVLSDYFKNTWIPTVWLPANPGKTVEDFRMPTVSCLTSDPWIGGYVPRHSNGKVVNTSYTDGHVRSHRIDKPVTSGGVREAADKWWYATTHP